MMDLICNDVQDSSQRRLKLVSSTSGQSSQLKPVNDLTTVQLACRREPDAFATLYESYYDRIRRYIGYRVTSVEEAEDLTEQVFLKAWESIDRFELRGIPFAAWLYRLAHNLVIDHYRCRHPSVSLDDTNEEPTNTIDISASVLRDIEAEELRNAIDRLSPEHQCVLTLRFIDELSHYEVASVLGKSEGATRVIQHRALAALARVLNRDDYVCARAV